MLGQNKQEDITYFLDLVRDSGGGLILSGGDDVFPGSLDLQVERGDNTTKWDYLRDKRELFAINYCFQNNVPILAICRGFQLMLGVKYNLGIMQDISGYPIAHSPKSAGVTVNERYGEYLHWVSAVSQEAAEQFFVKEWVISRHHQAIYFNKSRLEPGSKRSYQKAGIEVLGISDLNTDNSDNGNKKVDIIELARGVHDNWIGCQYHPEAGADYLRNPGAKVVVDYFASLINL